MNNRLRIVMVEPANSGGLIHFDYQLCTALSNAGADVTLIAGTEYELSYLPHNFKVLNMLNLWKGFDERAGNSDLNLFERSVGRVFRTLRRVMRGVRMVAAWINLTRYLLRSKPDLVQFSRLEYPFEFLFISFLKRRGFILSQICHEFESREDKGLFSKFFHSFDLRAYHSFSTIIFLAEESRKKFTTSFKSISEKNTLSVPHGNSRWLLAIQDEIDLRERYGIKDDEQVILFFGLLSPSKGIDDLIDAFKLVINKCNARLVIAGYPTKYININTIKSHLLKLKIFEKVVLDLRYIPLNEIGALMNLATVVVYPYLSGTQSGALQVAYTFGRPVIATTVGGLPEVVEDGKSGFLIPVHSPAKMAEKICAILDNPTLATAMGSRAHELSVTRFNWDTIARQILAVYMDVIGK